MRPVAPSGDTACGFAARFLDQQSGHQVRVNALFACFPPYLKFAVGGKVLVFNPLLFVGRQGLEGLTGRKLFPGQVWRRGGDPSCRLDDFRRVERFEDTLLLGLAADPFERIGANELVESERCHSPSSY